MTHTELDFDEQHDICGPHNDGGMRQEGFQARRIEAVSLIDDDQPHGTHRGLLSTQGEELRRRGRRSVDVMVVERLDAQRLCEVLDPLKLARSIRSQEEGETSLRRGGESHGFQGIR